MHPGHVIFRTAILAASIFLFGVMPVQAAREAPDAPDLHRDAPPLDQSAVRRVQSALVTLGLYSGVIDGKLNQKLTTAIRQYQQQAGLSITGRITDALIDHLERSLQVSRLLRDLESNRRKSVDTARQALLSHPATRDLIEERRDGPADATRDPTPCFEKPTVRCLLAEGFESAKAVVKRDLRDWAMGEILAAQARAGLMKQAMDTTRRIQDPRLVMVALRDIAQAQARAGRAEDALAAAEIIPDSQTQIEALAMIATTQVRHGHMAAARDTAMLLYRMARHLKSSTKRVTFATRAAVALYRAGAKQDAEAALKVARAAASLRQISPSARVAAQRQVAEALADMDRLDDALAMAEQIARRSDRAPILIAAAQSAIRAGRLDTATELARDIDAERYRAQILAQVAVARAQAGDRPGADALMDEAFVDAEAVALPFARSYAISRLALALSDMARNEGRPADEQAKRFARAQDAAAGISDARLHAQVLFEIAAQQRRAGLPPAQVNEGEQLAITTAVTIPSAISRVWIHGDRATDHARAGEQDLAWAAFDRALIEARKIDNTWARARAMAKLAQTLIDLVAPKTAAAPDEMSPEKP